MNLRRTLLIIDDDFVYGRAISDHMGSDILVARHAGSAEEGLALCRDMRPDVVLLDQKLPDAEGHTLCREILAHNPEAKILFITAHPSFENAVEGIKEGAFDYLSKPLELDQLELAIHRALKTIDLERVAEVHNYEMEKSKADMKLVGLKGGLAGVAMQINRAALVDAPVLITGETGTGKNRVARAIHDLSPYHAMPFISVNCASLPADLIEAELFGYEKGAFTGAHSPRKGLFEMAEGGTLLLDEIGEMPVHLQSRLLGVLDDKVLRRLGGTTFRKVQVRIIAATSVELEQAIAGRLFREDLYYRLSVVRIKVPPLRERVIDIPELCRYILNQVSGGRNMELTKEQIQELKRYPWPGNVRELRNIIERSVILAQDTEIRPSQLLTSAGQEVPLKSRVPRAVNTEEIIPLEEVERSHIASALSHFSGNYTRAAKSLGISLSTIKRKARQFKLA